MKKVILFAVVMLFAGLVYSADYNYFGTINSSTKTACVTGSNVIADVQLTNGTTIAVMIDFMKSPSLTSRGTYIETVIVPAGTTSKFGVGNISVTNFCITLSTATPAYDLGVSTNGLLSAIVWK